MNKPSYLPGVSYDAKRRIKKFKSVIRIEGILKSLGYFRTELEAHNAFLKAKAERDSK
jgi:hypothetical protein